MQCIGEMGAQENLDIYSNVAVAICTSIITFAICRHYFHAVNRSKKLRPIKSKKKCGRLSKMKLSTDERAVAEFSNRKKEIIAVTENIYTAVGYGLANCIVIQGKLKLTFLDNLISDGGSVIHQQQVS